ncbi:hypothetical protein ACP4OV_009423 [Aristida adscensionis]
MNGRESSLYGVLNDVYLYACLYICVELFETNLMTMPLFLTLAAVLAWFFPRFFLLVLVVLVVSLLLRCSSNPTPGRREFTQPPPFILLKFTESDILYGLKEENAIGRGGSGKVYRVTKQSGQLRTSVVVKKIDNDRVREAQLQKVFDAEVAVLRGIRHLNIVKLLGCISGKDDKLVYEDMENGSLDQWLRRSDRSLGWERRLAVAIDAAKGLSYMHHGLPSRFIHRDVKSNNILLDSTFTAKIGDFGLARRITELGISETASVMCGTFGYIAPEYMRSAKVSEKVDVYGFGVVLMELTTGLTPVVGNISLVEWARNNQNLKGARFIDKDIRDSVYLRDIIAVFKLGLICTSEDPSRRPSMSEVRHKLLKYDRSGTQILPEVKSRNRFISTALRALGNKKVLQP